MPATFRTFPELSTPRLVVSAKSEGRREDKKEGRELKLEISKWKRAKAMRRSLIGKYFSDTARAVAGCFPDVHWMDIAAAREAKYNGTQFRAFRKLVDEYVNSKVEGCFGHGCLVNPEKRVPEEECGEFESEEED
jgi:hypothetical protein